MTLEQIVEKLKNGFKMLVCHVVPQLLIETIYLKF